MRGERRGNGSHGGHGRCGFRRESSVIGGDESGRGSRASHLESPRAEQKLSLTVTQRGWEFKVEKWWVKEREDKQYKEKW